MHETVVINKTSGWLEEILLNYNDPLSFHFTIKPIFE
jgi:hypothetical protein